MDSRISDKITLEKIQFAIRHAMSASLIDDMAFQSLNDLETDSIIKQLTFYLWGNKVQVEEYNTENVYPATLWEELKEEFFPNWLKRQFPTRYSRDVTHHTITHWHICPHLNCKTDDRHLHFLRSDACTTNGG